MGKRSDPRLTFGAAARYGPDSAGPVGRRGKLKHPPVQLSEVAAIVWTHGQHPVLEGSAVA